MFSLTGNYNIRKGFLGKIPIPHGEFDSKYDQPTYLTFKLRFHSDENLTDNTTYDVLPQSLFALPQGLEGYENLDPDDILAEPEKYTKTADNFGTDRRYSAIDYLLSRNEDTRAYLLAKFIRGWMDLQDEYQFYFQSISGLNQLFAVRPDKGRMLDKGAVITIECLEGIDQKVKYLLSLYREIAWDKEYQRWILPDIYRFFKLDIYISEIRTFHQSNFANSGSFNELISNVTSGAINKIIAKGNNAINKITKKGINNNSKVSLLALKVMDNFCPVTRISCDMCDFDLTDSLYQDSYTINNEEMEKTSFKIRIRQAHQIYNWTPQQIRFNNLSSRTERTNLPEYGKYDMYYTKFDDQDWFNNTMYMSSDDKEHHYSTEIKTGWINNVLTGILNPDSNNALDIAADVYQSVKSGIAEKKANKPMLSKATTIPIKNPISLEKARLGRPYDSSMILTSIIHGIGESNTTGGTNVTNEVGQLFDNLEAYYKDLSDKQKQAIQNRFDNLNWAENQLNKSDSPIPGNMTNLNDSTIDSSLSEIYVKDTSIYNTLEGGYLPDSSFDGNLEGGYLLDSSFDGNLEGGYLPDSSFNGNLTPIGINDSSFDGKIKDVSINKPKDRSWATDLDGRDSSIIDPMPDNPVSPDSSHGKPYDVSINKPNDRSWATDLDGSQNMKMTELKDTNLDNTMTYVSSFRPFDRSWATDLDGSQNMKMKGLIPGIKPTITNMPSINKSNDRSLATDLDGSQNSDTLTNIEKNPNIEYDNNMVELSPNHKPEHKSMTSIDKASNIENNKNFTEIQQSKYSNSSQMPSIKSSNISSNLSDVELQSSSPLNTTSMANLEPKIFEKIANMPSLSKTDINTNKHNLTQPRLTESTSGKISNIDLNNSNSISHATMSSIEKSSLENNNLQSSDIVPAEKQTNIDMTNLQKSEFNNKPDMTIVNKNATIKTKDIDVNIDPTLLDTKMHSANIQNSDINNKFNDVKLDKTIIDTEINPIEVNPTKLSNSNIHDVNIKKASLDSKMIETSIPKETNENIVSMQNVQPSTLNSHMNDIPIKKETNDNKLQEVTIFERIQQSAATSRGLKYSVGIQKTEKPQSILLDNGKVNPDAKVKDIIEGYIDKKEKVVGEIENARIKQSKKSSKKEIKENIPKSQPIKKDTIQKVVL